jgi:hypothetical protein
VVACASFAREPIRSASASASATTRANSAPAYAPIQALYRRAANHGQLSRREADAAERGSTVVHSVFMRLLL